MSSICQYRDEEADGLLDEINEDNDFSFRIHRICGTNEIPPGKRSSLVGRSTTMIALIPVTGVRFNGEITPILGRYYTIDPPPEEQDTVRRNMRLSIGTNRENCREMAATFPSGRSWT